MHKRLKMSFTQGRGGPLFHATKRVYRYLRSNKYVKTHYKKIILTTAALTALAMQYYKSLAKKRLGALQGLVTRTEAHQEELFKQAKGMIKIREEQEAFYKALHDRGYYEWLDKKHGITDIEKIPRKGGAP